MYEAWSFCGVGLCYYSQTLWLMVNCGVVGGIMMGALGDVNWMKPH